MFYMMTAHNKTEKGEQTEDAKDWKDDSTDTKITVVGDEVIRLDNGNLNFFKFIMTSIVFLITTYSFFNMYIKYEELQLMKQNPDRFQISYGG